MEEKRVGLDTARVELSSLRLDARDARAAALRRALEVGGRALGAGRAVLFRIVGAGLETELGWDREDDATHELERINWVPPARQRVSSHQPAMGPLPADYVARHRVDAYLLATVVRDGRAYGVVSLEARGADVSWDTSHEAMAIAIADLVALLAEQAARQELERLLDEQSRERSDSEKLEALGRMARAVAHDFGNVLSTVLAVTASLDEHEDSLVRECIGDIKQAGQMGQRLIGQLLSYGTERSEPGQEADLSQVVNDAAALLRRRAGAHIELKISTVDDALVPLSQTALEQIVVNLVTNAIEAIVGSGCVELQIDARPDVVELVVADNGKGMDEPTLARVFEPFFTTRSGGHGLGLATVHAIVARASGRIVATSKVGVGTRFEVVLPRRRSSLLPSSGVRST